MEQQWKKLKGQTIVYVGDGKGKTTAAVGVAVRALGNGWRVLFMQFMKEEKWPSGERDFFRTAMTALSAEAFASSLRNRSGSFGGVGKGEAQENNKVSMGSIIIETVGEGFVGIMGDRKERSLHKEAAQRGYEKALEAICSGVYQLVVLDEVMSAIDENLLTEDQVLELITARPEGVTLVLTGHATYPRITEKVDLVTEMKKIKHPFDTGHIAMRGIDY